MILSLAYLMLFLQKCLRLQDKQKSYIASVSWVIRLLGKNSKWLQEGIVPPLIQR